MSNDKEKNDEKETVFYPVYQEIKEILSQEDAFKSGNFSLWYNKYVPLQEPQSKDKNKSFGFAPSDLKGKKEGIKEFYLEKYKDLKSNSSSLLKNKHFYQMYFCEKFKELGYSCVVIHAKLKKRFITGIGNYHPSEISLTLDRNLGIPYIPASSIKGVVRFAYILSQIFNDDLSLKPKFEEKDKIALENDIKDFLAIFGGTKKNKDGKEESWKGGVVFLDAYPVSIPELELDIMNPHYGDYYKEGKPPADYLEPNPIKFLTVAKNTEFVFRAVATGDLVDQVKGAIEKALRDGIGAKTALGYGEFEVIDYNEPKSLIDDFDKFKFEQLSEKDKFELKKKDFIEKVKNLKKDDQKMVEQLFNEWNNDEMLKDDKDIALFFKDKVRKKKSKGGFTSYYKRIAEVLGEDLTKQEKGNIKPAMVESLEKDREKALKEINRLLAKDSITKKEFKKISEKYKQKFRDDEEVMKKIYELKKKLKEKKK